MSTTPRLAFGTRLATLTLLMSLYQLTVGGAGFASSGDDAQARMPATQAATQGPTRSGSVRRASPPDPPDPPRPATAATTAAAELHDVDEPLHAVRHERRRAPGDQLAQGAVPESGAVLRHAQRRGDRPGRSRAWSRTTRPYRCRGSRCPSGSASWAATSPTTDSSPISSRPASTRARSTRTAGRCSPCGASSRRCGAHYPVAGVLLVGSFPDASIVRSVFVKATLGHPINFNSGSHARQSRRPLPVARRRVHHAAGGDRAWRHGRQLGGACIGRRRSRSPTTTRCRSSHRGLPGEWADHRDAPLPGHPRHVQGRVLHPGPSGLAPGRTADGCACRSSAWTSPARK